VANEYNTLRNRIAPPLTSIVKQDLNVPAVKWRVGFGDDPELPARGVTELARPVSSTVLSSPRQVNASARGATTRFGRRIGR
jgi:hypothetical protein